MSRWNFLRRLQSNSKGERAPALRSSCAAGAKRGSGHAQLCQAQQTGLQVLPPPFSPYRRNRAAVQQPDCPQGVHQAVWCGCDVLSALATRMTSRQVAASSLSTPCKFLAACRLHQKRKRFLEEKHAGTALASLPAALLMDVPRAMWCKMCALFRLESISVTCTKGPGAFHPLRPSTWVTWEMETLSGELSGRTDLGATGKAPGNWIADTRPVHFWIRRRFLLLLLVIRRSHLEDQSSSLTLSLACYQSNKEAQSLLHLL